MLREWHVVIMGNAQVVGPHIGNGWKVECHLSQGLPFWIKMNKVLATSDSEIQILAGTWADILGHNTFFFGWTSKASWCGPVSWRLALLPWGLRQRGWAWGQLGRYSNVLFPKAGCENHVWEDYRVSEVV
jgi:hypothetical protein